MRVNEFYNFGDRLPHTGFVIDGHHRHDGGALVERGLERVKVDDTIEVRADARDAIAIALEPARGAEHGLVLDPRGDDPVDTVGRGPGGALDGKVVALAAAASEDNLRRASPTDLSHDLAGLFERRLGRPAGGVAARRIAGVLGQERQHRLDGLGTHRRRGGVIEVRGHAPRLGPNSGLSAGVTVTPGGHTRTMSERSQEQQELRLIVGGSKQPDWDLDERTRRVGRQGVAAARAALRNARPPEPKEIPSRKAS